MRFFYHGINGVECFRTEVDGVFLLLEERFLKLDTRTFRGQLFFSR